ncbi:ladderlectin-like [Scomber scombrus]|uniref:Ladderlectin-like n=1 Tax=Scomber scombrus TaxID=13677 RepID=A0AAV1PXS9_SCOSC
MEEKMMKEEFMPEDSSPVPMKARFNFCPDGWFSHGSRCLLFVNIPMSWYNAEEHCNSMGANLASVSNPREYSYLQHITKTGGQSIVWLGGFYLQGRWLWIDREGLYYTNWYAQSTSSSYPCMYLRTTNGWGNTQCTSGYRFICSKNPFGC